MSWKTKWYKTSLGIGLLVLIFLGCKIETKGQQGSRVATLPYYNEASFTPQWLGNDSKALNDFHTIPAFELVNQEGEIVSEATFKSKIYVADFFFTTCPGICPKMTENMAIVDEAFKTDNEVLILSHSVTPTTDSVAVLKAYAEDRAIDAKKWHLVTGNKKEIYDLGRYAYFVEEDLGKIKTEDDFLHTENFVLIDKNKHIRGIYNGLNKTSVQQLITDIKTLQEEG